MARPCERCSWWRWWVQGGRSRSAPVKRGRFEVTLIQIGERLTLRLGVRDVIYSAQVTSVNGCSQLEVPIRLANSSSSQSCFLENFRAPTDAARAASLLQRSSSDVINNLGVSFGVGLLL